MPSARSHQQNAATSGRRLDNASQHGPFVSLIMEQLPSPPVIRCLPSPGGGVQTDTIVAANSCSESTNQSHCDSQAQLTQDKSTFANEPKWSTTRCDITDPCRLHGVRCCTCSTGYVDLTLCEADTQDEALDLSVSKTSTRQQESNEIVSSLTSSALSQTQSMQGLIANNTDRSHAGCDGLARAAVHPPDTYKEHSKTDIVSWSVQEVAEFVASIPGCACYRQVL